MVEVQKFGDMETVQVASRGSERKTRISQNLEEIVLVI